VLWTDGVDRVEKGNGWRLGDEINLGKSFGKPNLVHGGQRERKQTTTYPITRILHSSVLATHVIYNNLWHYILYLSYCPIKCLDLQLGLLRGSILPSRLTKFQRETTTVLTESK